MPNILVRSLNQTQYRSQSGKPSDIKCVGMLFDLLRLCPKLIGQLERREVVFGIDSRVEAYAKKLDLVIGFPGAWNLSSRGARSLSEIVKCSKVCLSEGERSILDQCGHFCEGTVERPLLVVEAKTVMTKHSSATPNRYSDLLGLRSLVKDDDTLTAGLLMVNVADRYVNLKGHTNTHQPHDALHVVSKLEGLLRRNGQTPGWDEIGTVVVNCEDARTPMTLGNLGAPYETYEDAVVRLADKYQSLGKVQITSIG